MSKRKNKQIGEYKSEPLFGEGKLSSKTPVFLGVFNLYDIAYASPIRRDDKMTLMMPFSPDKSYEASAHVFIDKNWIGPEISSMSDDERSYFMEQIPERAQSESIYMNGSESYPVYIPAGKIEIAARAPIFSMDGMRRHDGLDLSDVEVLGESGDYLHMKVDAELLVQESNKQRMRNIDYLCHEREGMALTDAVCADYSYARELQASRQDVFSTESVREKVSMPPDVVDDVEHGTEYSV